MRIEGSRVLITGGARRVGRTIVEHLAALGAHVFIHYNSSETEANSLVEALRCRGYQADCVQADFDQPERIEEFVSTLPPIDVLVNNASIFPRTPLKEVTLAQWRNILDVNLTAPVLLAVRLGAMMKTRGAGVIINLTDCGVHRPYPNYLPYLVSKGGLETATLVLAQELAPQVRVAAIAPGTVLPPPEISPAILDAIKNRSLLRRVGHPQDIAGAVAFVIENEFVTGCTLTIDGGTTIS